MKGEPFKGDCTIADDSSLRKRMRAARRGFITALVPSEKAKLRHAWYRKQKYWEAVRKMLGQDAPTPGAVSLKGEAA